MAVEQPRNRQALGCGIIIAVATIAALIGIIGIWLAVREANAPQPGVGSDKVTFEAVIDGDTIDTSAGRVRIIGIDTPERGQCGYSEASNQILAELAPGDYLSLDLPKGQNDTDRYGRLIRYVTTDDGIDIGLMQLEAGLAVARYDSQDGYPKHPKEKSYHQAQRAILDRDGKVIAVGCS